MTCGHARARCVGAIGPTGTADLRVVRCLP